MGTRWVQTWKIVPASLTQLGLLCVNIVYHSQMSTIREYISLYKIVTNILNYKEKKKKCKSTETKLTTSYQQRILRIAEIPVFVQTSTLKDSDLRRKLNISCVTRSVSEADDSLGTHLRVMWQWSGNSHCWLYPLDAETPRQSATPPVGSSPPDRQKKKKKPKDW